MKKLIWNGLLMLMGWIGITGTICSSAITSGYGVMEFIKGSGLTLFFTFSWVLFLVGGIGAIYHMYIKHLVDQLEVDKLSASNMKSQEEN